MKRINRVIIAALAASMALVSCVEDNLTKPEDAVIEKDGARVIAISFNQTTKTTLEGFQPKFAAGDTIKISNGVSAPENRLVKIDDHGNAYITTDLMGALKAVYPASAADLKKNDNQIDTIYGVKVPATQSGKFADANICTAQIQDAATTATFKNQVAILKFYVDKSIGVKSIKVTSDSELASSIQKSITVDPEADATIDEITDDPEERICYVAVLPGQKEYLKFTSETTTQETVTRTFTADVALDKNGMYNAFIPYYIDLGKAGKWAYCNIGAFLPEEPGKYFAWGDTVGQTWNGSSWSGSGFTDAPTVTDNPAVLPWKTGSTNYDAANVAWADTWCMPTKAQLDSLTISSVTKVWDDTKKGYKIYTTSADTAIFLPAAAGSEDMSNIKSNGHYWSSSLNGESENKGKSYAMSFDNAVVTVSDVDRNNGYTIRPVKTLKITKLELDATAELKLKKGETVTKTLTLKITPANATNQKVTWTSNATSYATVDSTGVVTAVAKGTATITAKIIDVDGTEWSKTCTVTVKPNVPEGILNENAKFSVGGKQIYFAKGNLIATINSSGSPTAWKFASSQYSVIGEGGANKTIGTGAGDVDLFGWSTDGTDATNHKPWGINTINDNPPYYGNFKDWGIAYCESNNITPNTTWRTPTSEEWIYILETRSGNRYAMAKVNDVIGLLIFPDGYSLPSGYTAEGGTGMNKVNTMGNAMNKIEPPTANMPNDTWTNMEAAGVVFLPYSSCRNASSITDAFGCNYWSATTTPNSPKKQGTSGIEWSNVVLFYNNYSYSSLIHHQVVYVGCSVRLVTDVPTN